jgi:hypothetical protein
MTMPVVLLLIVLLFALIGAVRQSRLTEAQRTELRDKVPTLSPLQKLGISMLMILIVGLLRVAGCYVFTP